jgi:hypothetical protein
VWLRWRPVSGELVAAALAAVVAGTARRRADLGLAGSQQGRRSNAASCGAAGRFDMRDGVMPRVGRCVDGRRDAEQRQQDEANDERSRAGHERLVPHIAHANARTGPLIPDM